MITNFDKTSHDKKLSLPKTTKEKFVFQNLTKLALTLSLQSQHNHKIKVKVEKKGLKCCKKAWPQFKIWCCHNTDRHCKKKCRLNSRPQKREKICLTLLGLLTKSVPTISVTICS